MSKYDFVYGTKHSKPEFGKPERTPEEVLNEYTGLYRLLAIQQYKLSRSEGRTEAESLEDAQNKVLEVTTEVLDDFEGTK